MTIASWPDAADQIFGSDQAVAFGYVTPARGVVLTPMTNFGLRERATATLTPLNSSIGMCRKLQRLHANPQVAIAYHTRYHSMTDRAHYVLVQGSGAHHRLHRPRLASTPSRSPSRSTSTAPSSSPARKG